MTNLNGTIIIRHLGYLGIDIADVLEALSQGALVGDRKDVTVDQRSLVDQARRSHDWADAYRHVTSEFESQLKPLLEKYPGYRVAYFGTVPIPLAMRLGMLVGTWAISDVFQHHHVLKDWKWARSPGEAPMVTLDLEQLPGKASPSEGDVIVRVSVSYSVDARRTQASVPSAAAEIDLNLVPTTKDLECISTVDEVTTRFREALDAVQASLPRARVVHVFASVPVGVAFRLGTAVSPTMHPRLQLYELDIAGTAGGHYPAFILQGSPQPTLKPTPEELEALQHERGVWREELNRLQALAGQLRVVSCSWPEEIAPSCVEQASVRWGHLPRLHELRGIEARVDETTAAVTDSFVFDAGAQLWRLDDAFLLSIKRRVSSEDDRRRAIRMFLLHESVHDEQALTRGTAAQVGRFARVLEEADYLADVWAFLYEYRLSASGDDIAASRASALFCDMIRVANETMMAFDDATPVTEEMQARRISRYLIWAWQYLLLERAKTIEDCFAVLFDKPAIELAGLQTTTVDHRLTCSLRADRSHALEIAILHKTRLHRYASGPAARLDLVLGALREHDASALRNHLRAVADSVLA